MSQRVNLTIPDDHYKWLEDVMKRRGWHTIQHAIRSLIEDGFRLDNSQKASKVDQPVSITKSEVGQKEIQTVS